MISLESKTQTSTPSSPLSLESKEESANSGVSFSELLQGVRQKKDDKIIQNGALVLALDEEVPQDSKPLKASALLELLKGEGRDDTKVALELNPELTKNLSPKELKVLIKDAKEYLKNKIISSEGFKKSEIEALPKTLKGLAQVAQKIGIEVGKITLEEIKPSISALGQEETTESKSKVPLQDTLDVDPETLSKKALKNKTLSLKSSESLDEKFTQQVKIDVKTDAKIEIKATPLFKAQASTEITTQQFVTTKINTLETNVPKKRADETLKLLLRGEGASKSEKGFTADFSVATARVIAPQAPTDIGKSLESLLRGDVNEGAQNTKVDALNIPKADSFEIKLNEAKQMTKYLSQDVKTAIEDYKSPFTRIKVALIPQRLGAVELTVVQRGNNLHINLSSNNAAINALALNASDLKLQLNNNGINNASLNFNNNSQSSDQGGFGQQQQQNSQNEKQAKEEYQYFGNEEQNEEVLNSLEIVVPYYA